MATPSLPLFNITIIPEYGYNPEQITRSLLNIHAYLNNASPLSEIDLSISNFAVSHLNEQPYAIKKSISEIRKIIPAKIQNASQNQSAPFKKIFKIFLSPFNEQPSDTPPVFKVIAQEKKPGDDDGWFLVNNDHQIPQLPSFACNNSYYHRGDSMNHVYECASPAKFSNAEIEKVIDTFYFFTSDKEDKESSAQLKKNEDSIKTSQKKIISSLGVALFEDYLPAATVWFKNKFIESLQEPSLALRLSLFTEKKKEPQGVEPNASQKPTLLQRALFKQAIKSLEGVQETLRDVLSDEKDREEFPSIVYTFIPVNLMKNLSKESKELLEFFAKFYLPDILEASVKSLQTLLSDPTQQTNLGRYLDKFLTNFGSDLKVDIIEIVAYVIQHNIPAPAEKGAEVFINKIQNKHLNTTLMTLLNNALIDLFFVEPGPANPTVKKILVSVITSLHEFLILLNNTKKSSAGKKTSEIAEMIQQRLCATGKLTDPFKTEHVDLLDLNIRIQIEELLWILLFPNSSSDSATSTISMKIMLIILSTYLQKTIFSLFTSDYLYILIEKLLTDSISNDNPFEYNTPPDELFSSDDVLFSKELDLQIKGISSQILKLGTSQGLAQKIGLQLLKLIPPVGDMIQKKLNKAFNSPAPMVPILLAIQFAYQVPEAMASEKKSLQTEEQLVTAGQDRFFNSLNKNRKPSFKSIINENPETTKKRQEKIDQILGTSSTKLEQKVALFAPLGTQNLVIGIVNNLYAIGKNDLILKELLFFLLNGLKAGLYPKEFKNRNFD
jgi:hypothetical protein